jgi:transketolase
MGIRVIHVGTHDSIGLGEDGPTHQPIEHLASLRAMPNLQVFRPADAVETAECWKLALDSRRAPSVLALSRQKVPAVRTTPIGENMSARGAYQLAGAGHPAQVTIFASGSEVAVALGARDLLEADGVGARVVSTPCWELFDGQPSDYQQALIGETPVRVAVEAGVRMGWDRFIGSEGIFVGMESFGASAPDKALFQHFGITSEAVARAAKARL